jgi:hypothetical protein
MSSIFQGKFCSWICVIGKRIKEADQRSLRFDLPSEELNFDHFGISE